MKPVSSILFSTLICFVCLTNLGCEQKKSAGDHIDEAIEETGEAIEEASDEIGEALNPNESELEDAIEDAGDSIKEKTDEMSNN